MSANAREETVAPDALRRMSGRELDALYADLHRRVFEYYEDADMATDSGHLDREVALARAQTRAAPLIEQARAVHTERVARLRRKARGWWIATAVVAVSGSGALLWLLLTRG